MDESTTTPTPADDGALAAQPTTDLANEAENQPVETTTPTDDQEAESSAPAVDENLAWLQNKGIDPQSPEALAKVAEMYRNAERAMHQSTQEKAQLQTALTTPPEFIDTDNIVEDPNAELRRQVQALTMKDTVNSFWSSNPDAKQYEADMTRIVTENPQIGALVQGGYLGLDNLYAMARGANPNLEASLKSEGGREALQKVADKQQAKAVTGAATSSAMSAPQVTRENVDSWYAGLSPAERASPETQRIVSGLLS